MADFKKTSDLLFVYGTLRSGSGNRMAKYLADRATRIGKGRAAGRLFDFGDYPGMLPTSGEADYVLGEVWRLHDVDATLPALDRYEGCVPEEPQPWIFRRSLEPITLDDGDTFTAWVYWYCGNETGGRFVESGDYLNAKRS